MLQANIFCELLCASPNIHIYQICTKLYNSQIIKNLLFTQAIILRGLLCAAVATADQSHHQSFKQVTDQYHKFMIIYDHRYMITDHIFMMEESESLRRRSAGVSGSYKGVSGGP